MTGGNRRSIQKKRIRIPTESGSIRGILLKPDRPGPRTGLIWIHGGGFATGMASMVYYSRGMELCRRLGLVVLSPGYRLSWQAPYPAALEDCYAALRWMYSHASELGIERILVGGESAGGGLAAALCMLALDRGEIKIDRQFPLYPMLDSEDTESSRDNHGHVWNTRRNHAAWKLYLRGVDPVPAYASPAKREDLSGLPPCYTFVCEGEPFYCETLTYLQRLREAGIEAEVDVYPGKTHAFDLLMPHLPKSRKAREKLVEQVRKTLNAGETG